MKKKNTQNINLPIKFQKRLSYIYRIENVNYLLNYKFLLFYIFSFTFFNTSSQEANNKDLSVFLNKDIFNKVLSKAKYPIVLMEKRNPGPPDGLEYKSDFVIDIDETDTPLFLYTGEEAKEIYSWAVDDENIKGQNGETIVANGSVVSIDNEVKSNITQSWNLLRKDAEDVLEDYEEFKQAQENGVIEKSEKYPWPENLKHEDFKIIAYESFEDALKHMNTKNLKGFKVGAKLKYLKVQIPSQPNIQFKSPTFPINQFVVKTTATGELWAKIPKIRCVKRCRIGPIKFCCGWKVSWVWRRVASVTLSPIVKANAIVKFSTPKNEKVLAKGEFTKLRLDHFILRKIPLRGIANRYIKNLELEIFDVRKWLVTIPVIDANIGLKKISIPPNNDGVEVIVELK